jgi:branched-chain amino acid transport system permease protein
MLMQSLLDGVLTGGIIALGAIGVSLGLQILRFANFAHSELITWGAYLTLVFVGFIGAGSSIGPLTFGWQLLVAMGLAAALTGALAWLVDVLIFRRMRNSGAHALSMVFAGFGAALIMRHIIVLIWGHGTHFYTRDLQIAVEVLPGARLLPDQIFILALTVILVTCLHLYLTKSRTGMAMRAMAESPALARVCGIEVEKVIRWTWMLSGALAAMAGVFLGLSPQLHPEMGFSILLSLFAAAILGGAGSLIGAVVGGLLVGLAENLSVLVVSPGYKSAMPFLLLLLVLFFRPQGIFGDKPR